MLYKLYLYSTIVKVYMHSSELYHGHPDYAYRSTTQDIMNTSGNFTVTLCLMHGLLSILLFVKGNLLKNL